MKKIQVFVVMLFLLSAVPQVVAQNKAKMSKAERKVMRESNAGDKEDQRSYAHKQEREHKQINRRERRAEKREGRI